VDILIYVISSLACEYFGMFLPPYLFQWNWLCLTSWSFLFWVDKFYKSLVGWTYHAVHLFAVALVSVLLFH
jgi:hypothetical protein